jgi:hypothetical protein
MTVQDPARTRFFILSLLRLGGAVLVMVGLVIAAGRWPAFPRAAGIVLTLIGAFDFAVVPLLLARRWRTPK